MPSQGDATGPRETRRDRLRRQTADEIKEHAVAQVAEGGPSSLSLNAIGRAMGMSGPAVYRYFASRDALLQALVTDGYADLTAALTAAAGRAAQDDPVARLHAVAAAYRRWALDDPQRYGLVFGPRPSGEPEPEDAIAVAHEAMELLLGTIAAIGVPRSAPSGGVLDEGLVRWAAARSTASTDDPHVLRLGVLTWSRLHGIVGLEVAGILRDMGLDAGLLIAAEVDAVVLAAGGAAAPTGA